MPFQRQSSSLSADAAEGGAGDFSLTPSAVDRARFPAEASVQTVVVLPTEEVFSSPVPQQVRNTAMTGNKLIPFVAIDGLFTGEILLHAPTASKNTCL